MAEMVTCPTCRVMLRVPAGAEMIRCPQCKTIVAIQPMVVEPAPAKPAIPLPFTAPAARPAPPPPPEPPPIAKAITRARPLPDDDVDDDRATPVSTGQANRPAPPRVSLDEQEERRLEEMRKLTQPARTGIQLLALSAIAAALTALCTFAVFFLSLFKYSGGLIVLLPILPLVLQSLLSLLGFALCCSGPIRMRSTAASGVVLQVVQFLVWLILVRLTLKLIIPAGLGFNGVNNEDQFLGSIIYAIIFNNLLGIVNLPTLIHLGADNFTIAMYVVIALAAALDFARFCLIGSLANYYAVEGKDPELGFQSMRFVYRMFAVMLFGFIGVLLIVTGDRIGFGSSILMLPTLMLVNAFLMWCVFAWGAQYQTLQDISEIIDAKRFLDKRARLSV